MHRIDGPGATVGNLFTEGDPTGGVQATLVTAAIMNALQEEIVAVVLASGQALSKSNNAQLLSAIRQLSGSGIGFLNGRMSIPVASASGSFTADEVAVETALGGICYRIPSFSKTINLGSTGAGGMDTGAAPASGFVSIYAIFNPTTGVSALLACAQATSSGPVYTGTNMPAGYTASALVSAWGTTAASLLSVGVQVDRQVSVALTTILSSTTVQTATPVSLASIVPIAAREISGIFQSSGSASGVTHTVGIASAAGVIGTRSSGGTSSGAGASVQTSYAGLPLATPQTVFFTSTVGGGLLSQAAAYLSAYTI